METLKVKRRAGILLVLVGGMFLLVWGLFFARDSFLRREGVKTEAEIVRVERRRDTDDEYHYTVYVEYTVGDTVYTSALGYYSSGMQEGDIVPVFYNPASPREISYAGAGQIVIMGVILAAGVLLAGGGLFLIVQAEVQRQRRKRLKEEGRAIPAVVTGIECKNNVIILNSRLAVLVCEDSDNNEYRMKFLFGKVPEFTTGDPVTVYADRADSRKFFVERAEKSGRETGEEEKYRQKIAGGE